MVVKSVLLILLILSLYSWTIIFYKYRLMRKGEAETRLFLNIFRSLNKLDHIYKRTENFTYTPIVYIFRVGYEEIKKIREGYKKKQVFSKEVEKDCIERSLKGAISYEIAKFEKNLPFLATTGSTAPFIGLFGTVIGIMNSFMGIGRIRSASLAVVAPGIAEALIATAFGLFAAIPAVIAYNYFINKLKIFNTEMEGFSLEFLNLIERFMEYEYRKE